MPERLLELAKSAVWILGAIVGLALWGARLEFQVAQKASREEVQSSLQRMERSVEKVDARTARTDSLVIKLVCRETPTDTACPQRP